MYGKLFTSMYDGTLCTRGPWQALVTFQQMVILANKHGEVDMTAEAISRRTTIPLEIIEAGIAALQKPDGQSRTPDLDGRRIILVSDHRNWGWHIVNYAHFRNMRSAEERREYMRKYQREYRKKKAVNADVNNVSNINQSSKQEAVSIKPIVQKAVVATLPFVDNPVWKDFKAHRKNLKAPMTDRAERLLLAKLYKLAATDEDRTAIVEQSIESGWKRLFPLERRDHPIDKGGNGVAWWTSDERTLSHGRDIGRLPRPGETMAQYRERLQAP